MSDSDCDWHLLGVHVHLPNQVPEPLNVCSSDYLYAEKWKSFSMGYKEFMGGLFDDNLTFLEGVMSG